MGRRGGGGAHLLGGRNGGRGGGFFQGQQGPRVTVLRGTRWAGRTASRRRRVGT